MIWTKWHCAYIEFTSFKSRVNVTDYFQKHIVFHPEKKRSVNSRPNYDTNNIECQKYENRLTRFLFGF